VLAGATVIGGYTEEMIGSDRLVSVLSVSVVD